MLLLIPFGSRVGDSAVARGLDVNGRDRSGCTALTAVVQAYATSVRMRSELLSWSKMASNLFADTAPSASLDCLKARAASTYPGAPLEHLGGLQWPQ